MSIYSFSFSPTGTSAKIMHGVIEGLSDVQDCNIICRDLTFRSVGDLELTDSDIVIAASPVYGGKIAPLVKQRLKGIKGNNARCIVIALYGNRAFENAVVDFASFMSDCGFKICGAAAFIGEHSYSTPCTPIASGRPDRQDIDDAIRFGAEIALRLKNCELREVDPTSLTDEPSPEEALLNFRNFVSAYLARQATDPVVILPQVDTELCDDCASCYDVCPTEAISPDRRGADPSKCIKCCACVKICPQGARIFNTPFAKTLSENFKERKSPRWIL